MSIEKAWRPVLEAVSFAGRAHRHQLRKDGQTPYACHVFRVCLVARQVFGIDDPRVLTAAVLHDTIEDTTTDRDDLSERFDPEIASWVAALSKDTRMEDEAREAEYMKVLAGSPWEVKVCKLADIFDNLMDSAHLRPEQRQRSLQRTGKYLEALKPNLPEQARRPYDIVLQLFAEMKQASGSSCSGPP